MNLPATETVVSVDNVSKKFARSLKRSFVYGARDIARVLAGRPPDLRLQESEFWAVRNVSLELQRGHSMGIVGLNGSGKTTLLRMISGILRPSQGSVSVHGRMAPMLALGAGFKPVLSGRENIFLNLSLLGVAEKDIRARYDSIVEFSELSEAIEAPIGTYSSGMLARLGFACAVHTEPQILIVDEVLSVGDAKFRMKCRNRINELRRNGTSMLLVSHAAVLVETLCDECLFLRKGEVAARGAPAEVLREYENDSITLALEANASAAARRELTGQLPPGQALALASVDVGTHDAPTRGHWVSGLPGELKLTLACERRLEGLSINVMVFDLTHQPGETVLFMMSGRDQGLLEVAAGRATVQLAFPEVGLRPGTYRLKLSVSQGERHDLLDVLDDVKLVVRDVGRTSNCLYFQPRAWTCVGGDFNGPLDIPDFGADDVGEVDDSYE